MGFVHIACVMCLCYTTITMNVVGEWFGLYFEALQLSSRSHRRCVVISMFGAAGE